MQIIDKIKADFMTAYKAKDMIKKDFLGLLKSEVTKDDKNPEDTVIVAKIKSMIKNAASTNSLSEDELKWMNEYLPIQYSEADLSTIIELAINDTGASTMKDMGKIMTYLKNSHNGRYDGKMASTLIKKLL
jgi:uncharacterized protein YqeY